MRLLESVDDTQRKLDISLARVSVCFLASKCKEELRIVGCLTCLGSGISKNDSFALKVNAYLSEA